MGVTLVTIAVVTFVVGAIAGWALSHSASLAVREDNARLRAELAHQQKVVPEKIALLEKAEGQLRESFEALANAALRSSTEEFLKLADQKLGNVQKDAVNEIGRRQQAFDELIKPIRDTLTQVDQKDHVALVAALAALAINLMR